MFGPLVFAALPRPLAHQGDERLIHGGSMTVARLLEGALRFCP